ncbi:MAG: thioredoxin [Muribaculaceae bacterium]|nr:thioredoxin [Muribaculaceae bacterium]
MALELTDSNIKEVIATGQPVVVDFWATWCGPCRAMSPTIDALAQEYDGRVVIGKYNLDEENDFASDNKVMSLPTILFFKNGKRTDLRLAGSQSRDKIVEKIEALLAL